jgi:hypothetical protein
MRSIIEAFHFKKFYFASRNDEFNYMNLKEKIFIICLI